MLISKPRKCMDKTSKRYILDRIEVDPDSGCWVWQLSAQPQTGYGQVGFYPYTAHKLAYLLWKGVPQQEVIRHSCHNYMCCCPDHLSEGTYLDNWLDSEETHRLASTRRRGRAAGNRMPITINGITYESKSAAMKTLRVTYATLMKIQDSS